MSVQFKRRTGGRGIEWCDETRNAIAGCMHECRWQMPDGSVAICYAEQLAEGGVAKRAYPQGFKHHYWREEQLKALTKGKDPLLIFCDSMSDLFAKAVPENQVRAILQAMRDAPHHSYQSLTKAAPQLYKYADDLPPNLWVGVVRRRIGSLANDFPGNNRRQCCGRVLRSWQKSSSARAISSG